MRVMGDLWDSYRREVLPNDAPTVQVEETQKAFYAGATEIEP